MDKLAATKNLQVGFNVTEQSEALKKTMDREFSNKFGVPLIKENLTLKDDIDSVVNQPETSK